MDWNLYRTWLTKDSTIGELYEGLPSNEGNRNFLVYTLEDRYRGDILDDGTQSDLPNPPPPKLIRGETCIPCGRYEVIWAFSPRLKRDTLRLVAVPYFAGILIHEGNTARDVEGCIAVGEQRAENAVLHSLLALAPLEQKARQVFGRGEKLFLNVQLAPGVQMVPLTE